MKTHVKIINVFSLGFLLCFLYSCQEELSYIDESNGGLNQLSLKSTNEQFYPKDSQNEYLEIFAKAIVKSLDNRDFRSILKTESLKMFDGDYDVLFKDLVSKTIKAKSIRDLVYENFALLLPDKEVFNSILKDNRLQISIPVNCEEWNVNQSQPLVTYVPANFDEKLFTAVKAFDAKLNEIWISTQIEPGFPVIVVGYCERVDNNGILLKEVIEVSDPLLLAKEPIVPVLTKGTSNDLGLLAVPASPTELKSYAFLPLMIDLTWTDNSTDETSFRVEQRIPPYNFYEIATLPANQNYYTTSNLALNTKYSYRVRAINESGSSNYSNIIYEYASERHETYWEYIYKMKFTDLNAVETWVNGAPEIRWIVYCGAVILYERDFFEPAKRSDINNTWYTYNQKQFRWYLDYGKVCTYKWIERDNPNTVVTITVPLWVRDDTTGNVVTLGSVALAVHESDDDIGTCAVDWRSPLNDVHTAGGIFQFTMKNISY